MRGGEVDSTVYGQGLLAERVDRIPLTQPLPLGGEEQGPGRGVKLRGEG